MGDEYTEQRDPGNKRGPTDDVRPVKRGAGASISSKNTETVFFPDAQVYISTGLVKVNLTLPLRKRMLMTLTSANRVYVHVDNKAPVVIKSLTCPGAMVAVKTLLGEYSDEIVLLKDPHKNNVVTIMLYLKDLRLNQHALDISNLVQQLRMETETLTSLSMDGDSRRLTFQFTKQTDDHSSSQMTDGDAHFPFDA